MTLMRTMKPNEPTVCHHELDGVGGYDNKVSVYVCVYWWRCDNVVRVAPVVNWMFYFSVTFHEDECCVGDLEER